MKQIEKYVEPIATIFNDGLDCYCSETNCEFCRLKKICGMGREELIKFFNSEALENLLSDDEYVILKNIDKKWKWIARDRDSSLWLYTFKPTKRTKTWREETDVYKNINLYNHLFQFIKWEDDDSYKIAKLLEAYEEEKKWKLDI